MGKEEKQMYLNNQSKGLTFKKEAFVTLVVLLALATAAPIFFKQQLITGTIVNASLILAVSLLGARDGLIVGLIPSSVALATGLLSPVLAPMIPFIIIGNSILVLAFAYLGKLNFWAGAVVGSLLKFAFLYGTSMVVIGLLINKQIAPTVAQMLSWPQLVTAVAGSIAAFAILQGLKKYQAKI
jgi:hypothetical protein